LWLSNPGTNFGWILISEGEGTASTSRRIGSRSDTAAVPVLKLTYAVSGPPPVIPGFTANPTNGAAPLTVYFTNLSSGATSYQWDFGDGNTNAATDPAYTYTNAGFYNVSLTAAGSGGTNTLVLTNYIVVTNAPSPPPIPPTRAQTSVSVQAGQFSFSFTAESNQTYGVDYITNLATGIWSVLTNIPAQAASTSLTITDTIQPGSRLYRVRTP
jgi:PKD repeat protein